MKRLTEKQKKLAYRWLVHGPWRVAAQPLYKMLLNVELATHRLVDARSEAVICPELREVTALIKTFERPQRCRALVSSIRRFYPDIPIIVVDDSCRPHALPGLTTHMMPYDSGVSAGRREGLSLVKTKYVINLDDDFVFFRKTDICSVIKQLEAFNEIDIVGGMVIDLPLYNKHERATGLYKHSTRSLVPVGSSIGGLEVRDKVFNFFVGRTESIRSVNWDSSLKRLDHADFFTRAKGQLVSVYNPNFRVLHVRDPFEFAYLKKRRDVDNDFAYLHSKYAKPWGPR